MSEIDEIRASVDAFVAAHAPELPPARRDAVRLALATFAQEHRDAGEARTLTLRRQLADEAAAAIGERNAARQSRAALRQRVVDFMNRVRAEADLWAWIAAQEHGEGGTGRATALLAEIDALLAELTP